MLLHPQCSWTILYLCARDDPYRAPEFKRLRDIYGARGVMGELNDGAELEQLADSLDFRERLCPGN